MFKFALKLSILFIFLVLVKECLSKPAVIAHRGASGYLPEHTSESKVMAYMMNSDFIEQDVVLTKDNHPIVLHDIYLDDVTDVAVKYPDRLNKTTNHYYAIDFDLDEIKKLKVSERPNTKSRFPVGVSSAFQISTLEEEIQLIKGLEKSFSSIYSLDKIGDLKINRPTPGLYVEIKRPEFHVSRNKANFSEIVIDLLKKYNFTTKEDNCILQCFNPLELRRIRQELNTSLTLVQLLTKNSVDTEKLIDDNFYDYWNNRSGLRNISTFADGIGPEKDQLIKNTSSSSSIEASDLYNDAKEFGLFIHAYTFRIDSLPKYVSSYDQLLDIFVKKLKLDGLFTDFPDLTINYILKNNISKLSQFWILQLISFMAITILLK